MRKTYDILTVVILVFSLYGCSGGGGNSPDTGTSRLVFFQVFPFTGLSDNSDTPTLEALSMNQALIDGNLVAGSGIDIGQSASFGGVPILRNLGLDFVNITSVNLLYVYIDRQVPSSVTSSVNTFKWDIYTSSDNLNWTLYQSQLLGVFDPFSNRFEIQFPTISTRYIKAAVLPLSVTVIAPPGTDVSNISITELQAYVSKIMMVL